MEIRSESGSQNLFFVFIIYIGGRFHCRLSYKVNREALEAISLLFASIPKRAIMPRVIIPSDNNKVKSIYFAHGVR